MNKYIIEVEIQTFELISIKTLPSLLIGKLTDGTAKVISARSPEECIECGNELSCEESSEGEVCADCVRRPY